MINMSDYDRQIVNKAIYLPLLILVLERDLKVFDKYPFKFKDPYIDLVEQTLKTVRKELSEIKTYMFKNKIKVEKVKSDEGFTMYLIVYKGNEEERNIFNHHLRNRTEEMMKDYLVKP